MSRELLNELRAAQATQDQTRIDTVIHLLQRSQPSEFDWQKLEIDVLRARAESSQNPDDFYAGRLAQLREAAYGRPLTYLAHARLAYAVLVLTTGFALTEGQLEEAIACAQVAISLAPDNRAGYHCMKLCYNKMSIAGLHKYDEAIQVATRAVELMPHDARAWFDLGEAYNENYDRNMKRDALEAYRSALNLDPELVPALFKTASVHRILNEYDQAVELYQRCIALDPESSYARDSARALVHIEKSRGPLL